MSPLRGRAENELVPNQKFDMAAIIRTACLLFFVLRSVYKLSDDTHSVKCFLPPYLSLSLLFSS
jgi:hypothetical protein